MKGRASVQWVLKRKHIGDGGESVGNCGFKTGDFRNRKSRKRID